MAVYSNDRNATTFSQKAYLSSLEDNKNGQMCTSIAFNSMDETS